MTRAIYESTIIKDVWNIKETEFDYFFLAIGSDFRAYQSLKLAENCSVNVNKVILFEFKERESSVAEREKEGAQLYKSIPFSTSIIPCSIKDSSSALKIVQKLPEITIKPDSKIAVDISCFTKPFFFTLLKWLKILYNVQNVTIFYTEPQTYVFDKGLYSSYHSSTGPIRVEEIPSYSGNSLSKSNSLLVIMLGFDGDLSAEINEDVAPQKTIIVNGFPSYSPHFKDISLISNEKLVNTGGNLLHYSSSTNPFDTYNLLFKIREENENLFLNIAPVGTKPMALGVCLFAIHHPDVRVIFPNPEKFENVTTHDAWNTWTYQISLDS